MIPRHLSRGEFLSLTSLLAGSSLLPRPADAAPKPSGKTSPSSVTPKPGTAGQAPLQGGSLRRSCRSALTLSSSADAGTELIRLGEWIRDQGIQPDVYGDGEFIQSFERRVAERLGFEDGCFMPTGTMGQLIALRIYAGQCRDARALVGRATPHVGAARGTQAHMPRARGEAAHGRRPVVGKPALLWALVRGHLPGLRLRP